MARGSDIVTTRSVGRPRVLRGLAALSLASGVMLLAACAPGTWFTPQKPTVSVSAQDGCPDSLDAAKDVVDGSHGSATLLLSAAPDSLLLCFFGDVPDPLSIPRAEDGHLTAGVHVSRTSARAIAAAVDRLDLSPPSSLPVNCPASTFSDAVLVFTYPQLGDVDLWWRDSGCQVLDNGRIAAQQAGSSSFGEFQQAVAAGLTEGS